jgi:Ca-activated chloride channel homolog
VTKPSSRHLVSVGFVAALPLFLVLISTITAGDQLHPGNEDPGSYTISVNVGLVILPVFVTDGRGDSVSGLQANDFHLYEDGHRRSITLFEPEDVPATVGLVVDNSASMRAKREEVNAAGLAFAQSSNPLDQMFVVNFSSLVTLGLPPDTPFTNNVQQLDAALSKNPPRGNTALYDGIAVALEHLKSGKGGRKALIVVSDGEDNSSQISLSELLTRVRASNAVIHTIGILDSSDSRDNPRVLKLLAKMTGGNSYFPTSASQVTAICKEIAQNIRHQYTLGYSSADDEQGRYHTIRVTAKAAGMKGLRVRTRAGYVIPSQAEPPDLADEKGQQE